MNLPLFIAGRYLFSKKSHSVINLISNVSAVGVALGTAALIIILSVYNGFDGVIKEALRESDPDFRIAPAQGSRFTPSDIDTIRCDSRIATVDGVLEEQIYVRYNGTDAVALVRGVAPGYGDYLLEGDKALCSTALARKLKVNPRSPLPLYLLYPDPDKRISMASPTSTLLQERVMPLASMDFGGEKDADLMIVPMAVLERLVKPDGKISFAEVRVCQDLTEGQTAELGKHIQEVLGTQFTVKDRIRQNETMFKMMKYEKAAIFLILIFVVIIVAFNIFGSLTMLMLEKKDDIGTMLSLGVNERTIKRTFLLEGWLVSIIGMLVGLAVGCLIAWLQQRFGLISMPGNYLISAYPVAIKWSDIALTAVSVSLVGLVIALIPAYTGRLRN